MSTIDEIIKEITRLKLGYARPEGLAHLNDSFARLGKAKVLTDSGAGQLREAVSRSEKDTDSTFDAIFAEVLAEPDNFRNRAIWAFFWAVAEAEHDLSRNYAINANEEGLNGIFLDKIVTATRKFKDPRAANGGRTMIGATHLVRKRNEGRTGADFAMILAFEEDGVARYFTTIVQAKIAEKPSVDIDRAAGEKTQLIKLRDSGIGQYLFYNKFGKHIPTGMSAVLVDQKHVANHVDSLTFADDFAVRMALLVPYELAVDAPALPSPEAALERVFPTHIPDIAHYSILVAVLNEHGFSPEEVESVENRWAEALKVAEKAHEDHHASKNDQRDDEPSMRI